MGAKHHYVPQFYLKWFSISAKPNIVNVYKRGELTFETHVKKIAAIRDLYTVTLESTGEESEQIEKMFSKIEGDVAPLFQRLANDSGLSFADDEFSLLALFIALLYNRGPAFRKKLYDVEIEKSRQFLKFVAQDKDRFDLITKRAGVIFKDENDAEKTRKILLNPEGHISVKATGGEGLLIKLTLNLSESLAPIIVYKRWYILESDASDIFVTSDNPVTLIADNWVLPQSGKGFANSSVVLPLTPTRCLFMTNEPSSRSINFARVSRHKVVSINKNTMTHAFERVFSSVRSAGIKKAFDNTKAYKSDQTIDIKFFSKSSV